MIKLLCFFYKERKKCNSGNNSGTVLLTKMVKFSSFIVSRTVPNNIAGCFVTVCRPQQHQQQQNYD